MVLPAPADAVVISITGDTTGYVTGEPPNDATGDLDATVGLPNPAWTLIATTWEISSDPALGTATINPFTGEWTYTIDPDEFAALDPGEIVSDVFVVEVTAIVTNPAGNFFFETETQNVTIAIEGVCFAAGTRIGGENGAVPVEDLQVGDLVETMDNGLQPVRWIESNVVRLGRLKRKPGLWPVRISANALAPGCPSRDLVVSQQHRLLVSGAQVELHFGTDQALASAQSLCHLPGIEICEPVDDVEYFHILLDRHEILNAEGAPAESLFLGEEALQSMTSDGLQELLDIFGDKPATGPYSFGQAARLILKPAEAAALT